MGKIRVKTIGDEEQEAKDKAEQELKRSEKKARSASSEQTLEEATENVTTSDMTQKQDPASQDLQSKGQALQTQTETAENKPQVKTKKSKFIKKKTRSTNYKTKLMDVEKNKIYSLSDALELLRKVKIAKFDATVELHINTTEAGINGTVKLPHGTGKEIKVAIADDAVLAEVEKGKINFDILIASPDMMPKLAKVARVLGPKGLMPNPKNGTISQNPEEAAKKFQGGQIGFKTESKLPIIHLSIGKTSFEDKQLEENIKTIITAIKRDKIRNITLKSTMSPGIKISI